MKHTESEVEERLRSFRATFKETSNAINDIGPRVNRVQSQLDKLSETLRTQMAQAVQVSLFSSIKAQHLTKYRSRVIRSIMVLAMQKTCRIFFQC